MSSSPTFSDHRNWSDLDTDLLTLIAARLKTTLDVARFSQVYPTWNTASYTNKRHPSKQFPWLLLSEAELHSLNSYCSEYTNPKTGCRRFIVFPKRKQLSFTLPAACGRRCIGSGAGCLLMLSINQKITMLCPLTGDYLPLPPQSTMKFPARTSLSDDKFKSYITKIVIGKINSHSIVAVAIAGVGKKLVFARPGGRKWTTINRNWSPINDAIFHQGRIYAVNNKGTLLACNLASRSETIANPPKYSFHGRHNWYIVFSKPGRLLLVAREYSPELLTKSFVVFELLLEEQQWLPVKDLGDQALFVGLNTSASLKASEIPGCEANCVYFTEDCLDVYLHDKDGGGLDTGYFNLDDSLVKRYYVGDSPYSPPLWYIPNLL